jgi:hypothetical protein
VLIASHRQHINWAEAALWAQRCWEDSTVRWTVHAVRTWIAANAPVEAQAAACSFLIDPAIWPGPGWDLGNGQTRYLAWVGSGAETALVSRT